MSNKNLGIILLSSVLTFGTTSFAYSQTSPEKTQQPAMGTQRQTGTTSENVQKAKGASQADVKKAQQTLKDQGIYNGGVDGTMSADFQKALRDYQTQNQLEATGKLDRQTMSKLGIVKKSADTKSSTGEATKSGTGKSGTGTTMKKGAKTSQLQSKDDVRQAQTALQQKGINPGPIDGIMGPKTAKALTAFQKQENLAVSGSLDQQTEMALGISANQGTMGTTGEENTREKPRNMTPEQPTLPEQYLQPNPADVPDIGSRSAADPNMGVGTASSVEDVRAAQMALKNRGFDPGEINGMLSSQTQDAVRKFQSANNLPVTGNFDNRTQAALGITVRGTTNPDTFHDHSDNSQPADIERTIPDNTIAESSALGSTERSPAIAQADRSDPAYKDHDKVSKADKDKSGKIEHEYHDRAVKAAEVLQSLTASSDNRIPDALLKRAEGIAVIPNMIKGAFGLGGRYGKGLVAKRTADGRWGAPAYISIGGGSFGAQLGLNSTDLVLVFTDKAGLNSLEKGMSLKVGVDVGVTAGPIGREAEVGVSQNLKSGIYAYSRSKGLFAGIALDGAVLDMDNDANHRVYGANADVNAIMNNATMAMNVNVRPFVEALERATPVKRTTER